MSAHRLQLQRRLVLRNEGVQVGYRAREAIKFADDDAFGPALLSIPQTEPIRRYPDLVVHRALLRELGDDQGEVATDDLQALGEHTSAKEREATRVEYLADEICLAWLLESELFERGWEEPFEGRTPDRKAISPRRPARGRRGGHSRAEGKVEVKPAVEAREQPRGRRRARAGRR